MTLSEYLEANPDLSQRKFARLTGIPQSTISLYKNNIRTPPIAHALIFQKATDGQVAPSNWYSDEELARYGLPKAS